MNTIYIILSILSFFILFILLSCILGKIKKYIHIHFTIKSPLFSTNMEIEATDKK